MVAGTSRLAASVVERVSVEVGSDTKIDAFAIEDIRVGAVHSNLSRTLVNADARDIPLEAIDCAIRSEAVCLTRPG